MINEPFKIYNASAGSGKTYTLVKAYLKVLLQAPYNDGFKNALAITFTNKAVGEMKTRIILHLKEFSNPKVVENPSDMFLSICTELELKPEKVQTKSAKILNAIIYNYAAFDIHTIDKFTQHLIRTFAYDLKLPLNFEVELDTELILRKAVNNLIAQAGKAKRLTKILVDFAIEKLDDDKSWDISNDLFKSSKLLIQENDKPYLELLKDKTLDDFDAFKKSVNHKIGDIQNRIISLAIDTLEFIEECGLKHEDFSRNSLPNFFIALKEKRFNITLNNKWQQNVDNHKLYTQKVSTEIAETIERIQPEIALRFKKVKQHILEFRFWRAVYEELTPLSVLNLVNEEINKIKENENILLISEFNSIISKELKNQPVPFIYERIGEKYKHFFIDEFQDTSLMQWENLIPLLENSLSSEGGTALIVGDAKQAIYRWRGGKAEQFIDLCNGKTPFLVNHNTYNLPANYRSHKAIIEFNSSFFQYVSTFAFRNSSYKNLYENCKQEVISTNEGYVNITFIDRTDENSVKKERYAAQVFNIVKSCLNNGFNLNDICVLVRYKNDGILISEYLIEQGIDIVSSETLLIKNALEIRFIIDLLNFLTDPENELSKINALNFLANSILSVTENHEFLKHFIRSDVKSTFEKLKNYGLDFNENEFQSLPLYEAIEYLIYSFKLFEYSNSYLLFFLDFVLDFTKQSHVDTLSFLAYYELKKDNLSIVSSQETEAVKIMTIHKAKGLEFPVVVFPFADLNIYKTKDEKIWVPIPSEINTNFEFSYIRFNQNLEELNNEGFELFNKKRAEQELDNINLLYVALTRAVEQLYIVSYDDSSSKGVIKTNTFSGFFMAYLKTINKWNANQLSYSFGNPLKVLSNTVKKEGELLEKVICVPKENHNLNVVTISGYLWNTKQQEAMEKGNLIHLILSKIKSIHDIEFVFNDLKNAGTLTQLQEKIIKPLIYDVVRHNRLHTYFFSDFKVYNERDIISKCGDLIRPDKLIILPNKKAVIIDYKTGYHKEDYIQQLENYQSIIEEMDLTVTKKILVYINDDIQVKEL